MTRTSLEVARQFNMIHCTLMDKIEQLMRTDEGMKKHFKNDTYIDVRHIKRYMYSMDATGYKILVDWRMSRAS